MEEFNYNESPFKIEGEVEHQYKSIYLQKKNTNQIKRLKFLVYLFSLLFLCSMAYIVYLNLNKKPNGTIQQLDKNSLNEKKEEFAFKIKIFEDSLLNLLDSLRYLNVKLQKDNQILVENSERLGGIFFEVQIGSFKNFNLDRYQSQLQNLRQERNGGTNKLLIGRFRSHQKAIQFEKDIKELGFENAYLVGRINGKLVGYSEALKELDEQK